MKQLSRVCLILTFILFASGTTVTTVSADKPDPPQTEFRERDEIHQTYEMGANSDIEVLSISGPVEITTGSGTTAGVHIIRTARNASDLNYRKISIERGPHSLKLQGEQDFGRQVQVNHRVILKLPRDINLKVVSISGPVNVGNVDGQVEINSISGPVSIGNIGRQARITSISGPLKLGQVGNTLEIHSVSGSVEVEQVAGQLLARSVSGSFSVAVAQLDERGISVFSVSGQVTLKFTQDINADLKASDISGNVEFRLANVVKEDQGNRSNTRARIGIGGPPILIKSVSGNVVIERT